MMDFLRGEGSDAAVLERLEDFRRRCGDRARLRISDEPEILGSGGALNPLRDLASALVDQGVR